MAAVLAAFQNCSDAVPTGEATSKSQSPLQPGSPHPGVPVSLSSSPANPTVIDTVTLTGSYGSGGYTYSKISGGGTLAGNVYLPAATGGSAQFEVTDVTGTKASITINVAVVPTLTLYRWVSVGGQVFFHNDPAGGGLGPRGGVQSGSIKIFQTAVANSVPIIKCVRSGLDYVTYVYFTTNTACDAASGYASVGTFGYAITVSRPNTVAASTEISVTGFLPNY